MALPWIVTPGTANPFLEGKEVFLLAGTWGMVLWTAFKRPLLPGLGLQNPWLGWVALYLVGMGLWHFQWQYLWRTPTQTQMVYNVYTWLPTVSVIGILLLIRTLACAYLRTAFQVTQLTQWLCASAALVACYAILQTWGIDQWFHMQLGATNTWQGTSAGFGNPSYCAIYLASLSPLCLLFKAKRYLFYLGLIWCGLAATGIRYAWVLSAIGIGSYLVSRWWMSWHGWCRLLLWLGLGVASVGVGWLVWRWTPGDERWLIWPLAWERLQSSPLHKVPGWTGYGLGSFELLMRGTPYGWAHNEWLQALVELGVIGTSLCVAAVGWTTRHAWRHATTSLMDAGWFGVWMVLLAASIFHFPFHLAPLIWVGVCAWAVLERTQGEDAYA